MIMRMCSGFARFARVRVFCSYLIAALLAAGQAWAMPGALDTIFDSDGKVVTTIGTGTFGLSVAMQPDGKVLVSGYSSNGTDYDFAIFRYLADGSLDPSFDGDGKVLTSVGTGHDLGFAIVLQPDGKVLVAGESQTSGGDWDIALVRYNADGSLDTSFGGDGR